MHPRVLNRRDREAHERIVAAVGRLAGPEAAARLAAIRDRDPAAAMMYQREAIADALEQIATPVMVMTVSEGGAVAALPATVLEGEPASSKTPAPSASRSKQPSTRKR